MNNNNYVVIMAGGIGSRFWPMSRTSYPKQFLDILGTGKTLLQSTYERFRPFIPRENVYVVTSELYLPIVKEQLPSLPPENIIGEPLRKNTAPCIAYLAMKLQGLNPAANLIVSPSDHLITDQEKFTANCRQALDFTSTNNAFVTLGIQASYANTGYGYIQYGDGASKEGIYKVLRFTEKPDQPTAQAFFQDGSYLWNSGIFIWKATDIIQAFQQYQPKMYNLFESRRSDFNTLGEKAAIQYIYQSCESISIDYAILEKADNVHVIPADFNWSDLGTWKSAWENTPKDDSQNAVSGDNTMIIDANGCLVHSRDKKLVLLGGVEDLIVVNTPDALMITKKENEQQIKDYLVQLGQSKGTYYL